MNKEDLRKARRKWRQKKYYCNDKDIKMLLTFEEYCELLDRAGITVNDIGQASDKYCLGRYNDEGDYTIDNCRFITSAQNHAEGQSSKRIHGYSLGGGANGDRVKGRDHYKSKGFTNTPWGKFNTLQEAADHPDSDCNNQTISKRIKRNQEGYFYSVD